MRQSATIEMPATLEHLDRLQDFLASFARDAGFEGDRLSEIRLVVEEALVNIFRYAYPHEAGAVSLSCAMDADSLLVTIIDRGLPFDPLSVTAPDPTLSLEERAIGGYGILLMCRLTERVDYRRDGDCNILTLVVSR